MTKSWEKYIQKHPLKNELRNIIQDIADNNLENYDINQCNDTKIRIDSENEKYVSFTYRSDEKTVSLR